jgi:hypothetical protein
MIYLDGMTAVPLSLRVELLHTSNLAEVILACLAYIMDPGYTNSISWRDLAGRDSRTQLHYASDALVAETIMRRPCLARCKREVGSTYSCD